MHIGKKGEVGKVQACSSERAHTPWVLHLKGFYLFSKDRIFRGGLRGGFK